MTITYTSRIDLLGHLQALVNNGNKLFQALSELQDDYNLSDKETVVLLRVYVLLTPSNL